MAAGTDQFIRSVGRDIVHIIRMQAVISRELEQHGFKGGSLEDIREFLADALLELDNRRWAKDGEVGQRVIALADTFVSLTAGTPLSVPDALLGIEHELTAWAAMKQALCVANLSDVIYAAGEVADEDRGRSQILGE
jgi:hypothetical protein